MLRPAAPQPTAALPALLLTTMHRPATTLPTLACAWVCVLDTQHTPAGAVGTAAVLWQPPKRTWGGNSDTSSVHITPASSRLQAHEQWQQSDPGLPCDSPAGMKSYNDATSTLCVHRLCACATQNHTQDVPALLPTTLPKALPHDMCVGVPTNNPYHTHPQALWAPPRCCPHTLNPMYKSARLLGCAGVHVSTSQNNVHRHAPWALLLCCGALLTQGKHRRHQQCLQHSHAPPTLPSTTHTHTHSHTHYTLRVQAVLTPVAEKCLPSQVREGHVQLSSLLLPHPPPFHPPPFHPPPFHPPPFHPPPFHPPSSISQHTDRTVCRLYSCHSSAADTAVQPTKQTSASCEGCETAASCEGQQLHASSPLKPHSVNCSIWRHNSSACTTTPAPTS
jgi:hypothetical protein